MQIIEKRICGYICMFVVPVCHCPCANSTNLGKATHSGSLLQISHEFQLIPRKLWQTLDLFYRKISTPMSRKVQWTRMAIWMLFEGTYISKWMNCRKLSDQIHFFLYFSSEVDNPFAQDKLNWQINLKFYVLNYMFESSYLYLPPDSNGLRKFFINYKKEIKILKVCQQFMKPVQCPDVLSCTISNHI